MVRAICLIDCIYNGYKRKGEIYSFADKENLPGDDENGCYFKVIGKTADEPKPDPSKEELEQMKVEEFIKKNRIDEDIAESLFKEKKATTAKKQLEELKAFVKQEK